MKIKKEKVIIIIVIALFALFGFVVYERFVSPHVSSGGNLNSDNSIESDRNDTSDSSGDFTADIVPNPVDTPLMETPDFSDKSYGKVEKEKGVVDEEVEVIYFPLKEGSAISSVDAISSLLEPIKEDSGDGYSLSQDVTADSLLRAIRNDTSRNYVVHYISIAEFKKLFSISDLDESILSEFLGYTCSEDSPVVCHVYLKK